MGLTNRLSDELMAQEKQAAISAAGGNCALYIPENVDYTLKNDGRFSYQVEVYRDKPNGQPLYRFSGECREEDLRSCAVSILQTARAAPALFVGGK